MSGFTKSGAQDYGRILLYPEYKLTVGRPAGPAEATGDAWQRPYSAGLALVNPSRHGAKVLLKGEYVDENGRHYAGSITLAATTGEILLSK